MTTRMPTSVDGVADEHHAVASPTLIAVEHVGKRYGATQALNDVSFAVAAGTSHALVGRNGAGKSTLVGVLTGMVEPDSGVIRVDGTETSALTRRIGDVVGCVFQRPQILPDLTVAENLLLGSKHLQSPIRWRGIRAKAQEILDDWDVPARPRDLARHLSVEQRQIVEIARALNRGSRLVILDEPTAQLDRSASSRLFDRIRRLQESGVTFIFISHHLHEIWEVCQEATVLRDGGHVSTRAVADLTTEQLIADMVGQTQAHSANEPRFQAPSRPAGRQPLTVNGLSGTGFHDVSFEVSPGEILGIAGLSGSGKTALAETIAGLRAPTEGTMQLGARRWRTGRLDAAIDVGIGYVPADRHVDGFVPQVSIEENITATVSASLGRLGWINGRKRQRTAAGLVDRLGVVPADTRLAVGTLSGGNQQKVVIGRALASNPSMLILIAPTAGVDIASKERIYQLIESIRTTGVGVVLVSDTLDELRLADRTLVMFQGRITAEFVAPVDGSDLIATIEGVGVRKPLPTSKDDE